MKNLNDDIDSDSLINPESNSWKDADHEASVNIEDSTLFETISEYMRGQFDLEEVSNDPSLPAIEKVVSEMVSDYHNNTTRSKYDEKFIRESFAAESPENNTDNKNVSEITAEWVREWHEKKQKSPGDNPKTEEIINFIKSSLEPAESEPIISLNDKKGKRFTRSVIIRYISLPAAAVVGVLILISTLLPSSDPEKLYKAYYEPFSAVSPVTRSVNGIETASFASAIASYKTGDYEVAATGFSEAILKDPSFVSPRFFLGLTQLALEDYDKAITLLSNVVNDPGEYVKEAQWYLGLAYLKTGEKEKAATCFEVLSRSSGFYSERSAKILRRLK